MRAIENSYVSVLTVSLFLVSCGCKGGEQPAPEKTDVQISAQESERSLDQTETAKKIGEVDVDIERGMQADYFEHGTERQVVQPIEKAMEIPTGPVTDGNSPDER